MLAQEKRRDAETWAIHLFDLQTQGFKPERVIADNADGLRSAHAMVLSNITCAYDHFHISNGMMDISKFLKNKTHCRD